MKRLLVHHVMTPFLKIHKVRMRNTVHNIYSVTVVLVIGFFLGQSITHFYLEPMYSQDSFAYDVH